MAKGMRVVKWTGERCACTSATTASSSTGLNEQVEYTMRPPTFRRVTDCRAMRSWRAWIPLPLTGDHRRQMSPALRIVPSPLHGTSQRMRSYCTTLPCTIQVSAGFLQFKTIPSCFCRTLLVVLIRSRRLGAREGHARTCCNLCEMTLLNPLPASGAPQRLFGCEPTPQ